jgi:catechol 2,3-dioxygenase-like lactoylglutathione lyase family enzyme
VQTELDHVVLGCADLARGAAWLERFLGVTLSNVGEHDAMGTHNRLLAIGERRYLELIAINPAAATPAHPRWFGLDTADVRERIAVRPRLIGWVARVSHAAHGRGARAGAWDAARRFSLAHQRAK